MFTDEQKIANLETQINKKVNAIRAIIKNEHYKGTPIVCSDSGNYIYVENTDIFIGFERGMVNINNYEECTLSGFKIHFTALQLLFEIHEIYNRIAVIVSPPMEGESNV